MAFFGVTLEKIASSVPVPDSDRLDKTKLVGMDFQFVTGRGQWKEGDAVLYFPLDSVLPTPLQEALGVTGKLAGKDKNRIRTVRLRNTLSQGLVGPTSLLDGMHRFDEIPSPEEITKFLGVEKYEPPVIADKAGRLVSLPESFSVYDIEGCDRFFVPAEEIMDELVWVYEKLEGQNGSVLVNRKNGTVHVNQRRYSIVEIPGHSHVLWKTARDQKLIEFVTFVTEQLQAEEAAVVFELCGPGIQGNIYGLPTHKAFCFDVKVDSKFIDKSKMRNLMIEFFGLEYESLMPPCLCDGTKTLRQFLDGKSIKDASNGKSIFYDGLREGFVINPIVERYNEALQGRLILKQRSPDYLLSNDT